MKRDGLMKNVSLVNILTLVLFLLAPVLLVEKTQAAVLDEGYVRIDRLRVNTATSGTVCAIATTVDVEDQIQVTFPTGFGVVDTEANWVVNDDNLPNGSTFWIGMTDGVTDADDVTGQVVTWPSGNMVVGTLYCFNFSGTSTLTTKAAPAADDQQGTIKTLVATAELDSLKYALSTITDDQIVITAVVPPIFGFALSGNTDTFSADLSPSAIRSTTLARTVTIDTNADNGWVAWVKSANAGLNSASTGGSIATAGTVNNTPEDLDSVTGYVLDVDITSEGSIGDGDVTQASNWGAEYAGADATQGGSLSTTFQPIAASDGTSDEDILTLIERAKITSVQIPATDYTDTLTVIAAGRF